MYNFFGLAETFGLLIADREQKVEVLFGFEPHHFFEDVDGLAVLCVEDVADSEKVLEVEVVGLGEKGLLEDVDGVSEAVAFEMFIDFVDGGFDKSVGLAFFVDALDDKVDFLLILAGRVVLAVDGLLQTGLFVLRPVLLVGRRQLDFLFFGLDPSHAVPLGCPVLLLVRFVVLGVVEHVFVLRQRPLVRRHDVLVIQVQVVLQLPSFPAYHVGCTPYFGLPHNS